MRSLKLIVTMALLLTPTLHAQTATRSWQDPDTWQKTPAPITTKDIVYFAPTDPGYDANSQVLDVYQNVAATPTAKAPVLVYMHGGAWNHGERPTSWHQFRAWLSAGFSIVTVDYRLVDAAPAPAAVQDVRCVLSWIKKNSGKYNFDANRVVTYGTSAGGHLALLAAVLPADNDIDLPQCKLQPHVSAVLDFYGPYHLEPNQPGSLTSSSTPRWMGPDPQPNLLAKEHAMSPSTYIRPGIAPVFMAQGDKDPEVPYAASVTLQKDLDKVGVKNLFDTVPHGGHGGWPAEENERVQLDSLNFLQANGVIP